MNGSFLMASTSSITVQSLGKVVLRAPAVGAKTWCLYVCFFFVTLRSRRAVRSTVTYFEQVLCRGLWVDFDDAYTFFQHLIAVSKALGSSDYCC